MIRATIRSLALLALLAAAPVQARSLASPFAQAPRWPDPAPVGTACPPAPAAVRDLRIETAYAPGDYTRIDPGRAAARQAAVKPLHAYLGSVVRLSDEAMRSTGETRRQRQLCAERWLTAWADQDALLGDLSPPDGAYERKWALAALSLAYLKMYGAELPDRPPEAIARWLGRMLDQVRGEYPAFRLNKNNHYYWAGLAVAAAATVLDRPDAYHWAEEQSERGLSTVDADGYLPNEVSRGGMALYYHAYSASALSALAAFRSANGAAGDDPRLRRLVHRVFEGLADPAAFAARAGAAQTWHGGPDGRTLAWLELYRRVTGDAAADPWIAAYRPLQTIWLGGDMTHAVGEPAVSGPAAKSPLSGH